MSLREQLETIRADYGDLTPQAVVDAARPKGHPLHDRVFDRPVKDAAEAYYLDRAHRLIQVVQISMGAGDSRRKVRAYLPVPRPDSPQPGYDPTEEVMADPFRRTLVLTQMEREWRTMQARYGDLVEFGDMVKAAIDQAVA